MNLHTTSMPLRISINLLSFFAGLFFCTSDGLHAQQSYVERIPILIEFLGPLDASGNGLQGQRPSWRLVGEPSSLQGLGLIREADRVTLEVSPLPGATRIGSWSDRWKTDGGKDCSGWGPWKKCTQKWVFQDCPMNYDQVPLRGPVVLEIALLAEGTNTSRETIVLRDGVTSASHTAQGPRRLEFSGKFDREPLGCPNPGQTRVDPITKGRVMGDGRRELWFTVAVTVKQPALED